MMHWVVIFSKNAKSQVVPLSLANPILEEMEERGTTHQMIETTEVCHLDLPWRISFPKGRRSLLEIPFHGLVIYIYADDLEPLLAQLGRIFPRRAENKFYFKIHGGRQTLCLYKEQKKQLEKLLLSRREEATWTILRDWNY